MIESLSIMPTTSSQTITASGGVDGYSPISVSAVTSSIDNNIISENIKSGVSILGVSGSVIEKNTTVLSITPSTSAQMHTPSNPYNGYDEVSVDAVTSSIDSNIIAGNIKKDVTILGVTGTYDAGGGDIDIITAKNNTGASIDLGNKVWICKDSGDSMFYLRTFTYINQNSFTGFAASSGANGAEITANVIMPDSLAITLSTTENNAYLNVR